MEIASPPQFQDLNLFSWKEILFNRLKNNSRPVISYRDEVYPGAAIWTSVRLWINSFRKSGLEKGDRIFLCVKDDLEFLFCFLAGLYENLSIFVGKPGVQYNREIFLKAGIRAFLVDKEQEITPTWMVLNRFPESQIEEIHKSNHSKDNIRLWIQSSGTTGKERWIGLKDQSLFSVLKEHLRELNIYEGARVYSVLPWFHIFGLILDCVLYLLAGLEIFRVKNRKNLEEISYGLKFSGAEYFSTVPYQIELLIQNEEIKNLIQNLKGGIIGGAPISKKLAKYLKTTSLRVGYGQTEASPGITLGKPGIFSENYLGFPLGCEVKLSQDNEIMFKGKNTFSGKWNGKKFDYDNEDRWVHTGDLGEKLNDGSFVFKGRTEGLFKLSNGYFINPYKLESTIQKENPKIQVIMIGKENNGEQIFVLYSSESEVDENSIMNSIGSLKKKISFLQRISQKEWIRTKKGEISRKEMRQIGVSIRYG